jgi:hypothetical protein
VGYFFIRKQKIVLFPKYRENGWESAASALRTIRKSISLAIFRESKSTSSSYPILVPFPIFKENFMKNIKKPPTADALYLDEGVENE